MQQRSNGVQVQVISSDIKVKNSTLTKVGLFINIHTGMKEKLLGEVKIFPDF
jgi:hypothetical protein